LSLSARLSSFSQKMSRLALLRATSPSTSCTRQRPSGCSAPRPPAAPPLRGRPPLPRPSRRAGCAPSRARPAVRPAPPSPSANPRLARGGGCAGGTQEAGSPAATKLGRNQGPAISRVPLHAG
jgi:hypothetical protein